ncbi:MAG: OpgC domain-containing protein, partial [Cyanobacteria bacterium]|nr:OpgC domain-containing protein [Cyanobacteriota bacterium]
MDQSGTGRIDALTTFRFFAAALIVVEHAQGSFALLDDLPGNIVWSQGITFFFVLSGFILTFVYPQLDSVRETVEFLAKRVARIWPLHVSVFFLRALVMPSVLLTFPGAAPKVLVLLANLAMVHAWIP